MSNSGELMARATVGEVAGMGAAATVADFKRLQVRKGPPFDGKPCPMCPGDLRNLAAVAHNLSARMNMDPPSYCKIPEKLTSLRLALEGHLETEEPALLDLISVARQVAAVSDYHQLFSLKDELNRVLGPVRVLSDVHFADREHSHGQA